MLRNRNHYFALIHPLQSILLFHPKIDPRPQGTAASVRYLVPCRTLENRSARLQLFFSGFVPIPTQGCCEPWIIFHSTSKPPVGKSLAKKVLFLDILVVELHFRDQKDPFLYPLSQGSIKSTFFSPERVNNLIPSLLLLHSS